jgi:hypothetical protein
MATSIGLVSTKRACVARAVADTDEMAYEAFIASTSTIPIKSFDAGAKLSRIHDGYECRFSSIRTIGRIESEH